jgi:hypothetical protein
VSENGKGQREAPESRIQVGIRHVWGVDFSGAVNAGKKIWIARGEIRGGVLHIESCQPAKEISGFGIHRDDCMKGLCDFVAGQRESVIGLDFPFGLPQTVVQEKTWEEFLAAFPTRYPDAESFRNGCHLAAGGSELKRLTDKECQNPFSPYNLKLYRQTYYGIRDFLGPIVAKGLACVPPIQKLVPGKPWVLEICPAATLKREKLYITYKGKGEALREIRCAILEYIESLGFVRVAAPGIWERIAGDRDGDGLDSIIAAMAAFRAVRDGRPPTEATTQVHALEGVTYV